MTIPAIAALVSDVVDFTADEGLSELSPLEVPGLSFMEKADAEAKGTDVDVDELLSEEELGVELEILELLKLLLVLKPVILLLEALLLLELALVVATATLEPENAIADVAEDERVDWAITVTVTVGGEVDVEERTVSISVIVTGAVRLNPLASMMIWLPSRFWTIRFMSMSWWRA